MSSLTERLFCSVRSLNDVLFAAVNSQTRMKPKKAVVNAAQYISLS